MKNDKQQDIIWESEFHELGENEITVDILLFTVMVNYIKEFFVFLNIKEKATIKKSKYPNCNEIQVKCPYCQNVSIQEQITRNYFCPFCYKKSYINTSSGLSPYLLYKRYNIPRKQRCEMKKNEQRYE